jgi:hypothetical protein
MSYQDQMLMELNDRLEKAEAERDALKQGMIDGIQEAIRQVRKLESERDALKAALERLADENVEWLGMDGMRTGARQALKKLEASS